MVKIAGKDGYSDLKMKEVRNVRFKIEKHKETNYGKFKTEK